MCGIAGERDLVGADDEKKQDSVVGGRGAAFCLVLLGLLLAAGCDRGGLNLAPVDGVVTFKGVPVAEAGVVFAPCDPSLGPPAAGATDAEGRFTLVTANRPGALVGDHNVAISKDEAVIVGYVLGLPRHRTKYGLPPKYASPATSDLKVTVVDDDNHFEFDLIP